MADPILPFIAELLARLDPTTNPFQQAQAMLNAALYPATRAAFHTQIIVLLALFGSVILVILAGLAMRIAQGRFWLIRRIQGMILMPNTSVCYGFFALAYLAVGILNLVFSLEISQGTAYPKPYVGFLGAWSSLLWLGMWTELWSTLCSVAFRKYGMQNDDKPARLVLAFLISILVPFIAVAPTVVLMALANVDFNIVLAQYQIIATSLASWSSEWTPGGAFNIGDFMGILPNGEAMGEYLIAYSWKARCGYYYSAAVFLLTFIVYIVVVAYEIANLKVSAGQLRGDAPLPDDRISGALGPGPKDIDQIIQSEWFSGAGRQASLLEWVAMNRTWTAVLMGMMMLENAGLSLWYALTPVRFPTNGVQFQAIILVSCYVNGSLCGPVSLLILARSLDGSSPLVRHLKRALPFLPVPPAVGLREGTETIFQIEMRKDGVTEEGSLRGSAVMLDLKGIRQV